MGSDAIKEQEMHWIWPSSSWWTSWPNTPSNAENFKRKGSWRAWELGTEKNWNFFMVSTVQYEQVGRNPPTLVLKTFLCEHTLFAHRMISGGSLRISNWFLVCSFYTSFRTQFRHLPRGRMINHIQENINRGEITESGQVEKNGRNEKFKREISEWNAPRSAHYAHECGIVR